MGARLGRQWGSCRGLWLPRQHTKAPRLWVCTDMHDIMMKWGRGCGLGRVNGRGWPARRWGAG